MRVVITGIGAVSPVGLTAGASFEALLEGRSGVRALEFVRDQIMQGLHLRFRPTAPERPSTGGIGAPSSVVGKLG